MINLWHFLKSAAEGGYDAYCGIGFIYTYQKGLGVPKSLEKAFHYFRVAADNGIGMAQYFTGIWYINGKGVDKDISLTIKYLSLGADQNYMDAAVFLPALLIVESDRDSSYLFQAIYRIKCAIKIIKKTDENFKDF